MAQEEGSNCRGLTKTASVLIKWALSSIFHTLVLTPLQYSRCAVMTHNEVKLGQQKRNHEDDDLLFSALQQFNVFSPSGEPYFASQYCNHLYHH